VPDGSTPSSNVTPVAATVPQQRVESWYEAVIDGEVRVWQSADFLVFRQVCGRAGVCTEKFRVAKVFSPDGTLLNERKTPIV
jgi:hypothetical protein